MLPRSAWLVWVAIWAGAVMPAPHCAAQEPDVSEQYKALVDEFEADRRPAEFAPRFLRFAEEHASHPAAVDALVWVITQRRYRSEAAQAVRILEQRHLQSERLGEICRPLARIVSRDVERLLRSASEKSKHAAVRAQASFHLAKLLEEQTRLAGELANDPGSKPRVQQYYGKETTDHLASLDLGKVDADRERIYERIAKLYRDEPGPDGQMLGTVADKALFAIRHLAVGKPAPEIDAEDIDGVRFKLSDYRGKVVVLSFWGHW